MNLNLWKKIYNIIPNIIRKNFLRKVIAITFAVIVYIKISHEVGDRKVIRQVPIDLDIPANIEVVNYTPKRINVTVKGAEKAINLINSSNIQVDLPLQNLNKQTENFSNGRYKFELKKEYIKLPDSISLESFSPSSINLYCDKSIVKQVEVNPVFQNTSLPDYEKEGVKIIPDSVKIKGPKAIVQDINSVMTKPIYINESKITNNFRIEKQLKEINKNIKLIPNKVKVKIETERLFAIKIFEDIPVKFLINKDELKNKELEIIGTNKIKLILIGVKNKIKKVDKKSIMAFIEVKNFDKKASYKAKVHCCIKNINVKEKFIIPSILKYRLSSVERTK